VQEISPVVETFFARQPIFDRGGQAFAYELLYRGTPDAVAALGIHPSQMATQVTVDAMLGTNLAAITDGRPAFLNVSREILLCGVLENLDPSRLVIEIIESIEPDDEVLRACDDLVKHGHKIALDDWFENDPRVPLLPFATIVKIDVLERTVEAAAALGALVRSPKLRLVAERVETAEVHEACLKAGFDWFQGYFYRRPEIVHQPDLRPEQITIVNAMNLVQDDATPDHAIGAYFKRDPALAYKLVRMANVAPLGMRRIESVEQAVSIVGRAAIFRWLGLLLAASFPGTGGIKHELLREALVRARQCELLAYPAGLRHSGHLFLVGLFSRIESLLGVPLATIVDRVILPEPVAAALRNEGGPYAPVLSVTEAYEECQWDRIPQLADSAGFPATQVPVSYREAVEWALQIARTI
jgi:EAL and modified HD-GYP domain-containing signal transduction protein